MLRTLFLLSLGTFLTSGWKLVTVPLEKQGCSNSQKKLVCAEKSGNYQIFMNECYFKSASKTNTYNLTDPKNCNYFKDYVYVEFPTCAEAIQKANEQKLVYTQSYYSLIKFIENDFKGFQYIRGVNDAIYSTIRYYREQMSLLNQLKNSLNTESSSGNKLTWPTNCGVCTDDYVDTYEMCLDKELQNFNNEQINLEIEWGSLRYIYLDSTDGKFYQNRFYVVIKKITTVQAEEYLVNSIENLNKKYSKQMDILRNSTIPNDVITTGEMLIDYLRIHRAVIENKFVADSIDRLIYAVEGLIQPFDSFRYTNLEPLMTFLYMTENAFYENMLTVSGYEYVFTAYNNYFTVLKDTNSISLAAFAWFKTIWFINSLIKDFIARTNDYGTIIFELNFCISQRWNDFNSITPAEFLKFQTMVSSCYTDYQEIKLCLDVQNFYATLNLQNKTGYKKECISWKFNTFYDKVITCCF